MRSHKIWIVFVAFLPGLSMKLDSKESMFESLELIDERESLYIQIDQLNEKILGFIAGRGGDAKICYIRGNRGELGLEWVLIGFENFDQKLKAFDLSSKTFKNIQDFTQESEREEIFFVNEALMTGEKIDRILETLFQAHVVPVSFYTVSSRGWLELDLSIY